MFYRKVLIKLYSDKLLQRRREDTELRIKNRPTEQDKMEKKLKQEVLRMQRENEEYKKSLENMLMEKF